MVRTLLNVFRSVPDILWAPGIPRAFFEAVVEHVRQALGQRVSLSVERTFGAARGPTTTRASERLLQPTEEARGYG